METICMVRGKRRLSALAGSDKMPDNAVVLAQDRFNLRSFAGQLLRSILAEMSDTGSIGVNYHLRRPGFCDGDQGYFIWITTSAIRRFSYSLLNNLKSPGYDINHRNQNP